MDKRLLGAGLVLLGFVVLAKTPLLSVLFAFFILGILPGTDVSVPFWVILIVYPLIFFLVLGWFARQSFMIGESTNNVQKAPAARPIKRKKTMSSHMKRTAAKRRPRTAV